VSTAWTLASAYTQTARREPSGAVAGYAMRFSALAELPAAWAPYDGAQVQCLHDAGVVALQPLVGVMANEVLADASDVGLARWWRERLQASGVPGLGRVALQTTAQQGVDMDDEGRAFAWRRYRLRCAHFLPHVPPGHKCGRLHGHDFEVVVHARIDANAPAYEAIDAAWAPLHFELNYQRLNDLPGLENPTSEVMSAWVWRRLHASLNGLAWVTVFETASCGANFDGRHYRIWKELSFDSATRLASAPAGSDAARVHGHTYTLRLHLLAELDPTRGWTVDFGDVKQAFAPVFAALDHQPLHEHAAAGAGDSLALAQRVWQEGQAVLPALERVTLLDGPASGSQWCTHHDFLPLPL
jgi:6-pyruvoyltetrahydropterin/6-carboxytetrahydropterin synthase